jgi:MFS transporter, OFA family, oxalate/formate antiporter
VGELQTFGWLGGIFIVVCVGMSFLIRNPPAGWKPAGWTPKASRHGVVHQDIPPMGMLRTPQFYLVTITLALACMAGLMMIGFAAPIAIAKGLTPAVAALGVMIISIFNSAGRLFWGWVSDHWGRKLTVLLLLAVTAGIILLVNWASGYMILALIAVVGFSYGGFLGTFPAITADFWGPKNMGVNYGIILLGFGIGAIVSSYIAGFYKNQAAVVKVVDGVKKVVGTDLTKMQPAFIIAAAAAVVGIILMVFLKPPKQKAA